MEYTKEIRLKVEMPKGYIYFLDKNHPLCTRWTGRVYYHRHVASLKVGHWLAPREQVHHVDGNVANNDPNNLVVLTRSEHSHTHHGFKKAVKKICKQCGLEFSTFEPDAVNCSEVCARLASRKVKVRDMDAIKKSVSNVGYEATGRIFGVSGTAVKKWIRLDDPEFIKTDRRQFNGAKKGCVRKKDPIKHGTIYGYRRRSCRCPECTKANTEYHRNYRKYK